MGHRACVGAASKEDPGFLRFSGETHIAMVSRRPGFHQCQTLLGLTDKTRAAAANLPVRIEPLPIDVEGIRAESRWESRGVLKCTRGLASLSLPLP